MLSRTLSFLAALALAIGSATSRAEDPPFLFTPPKAVMNVQVPEELESLGVPVRIEALKSEASLQELIDYYYTAFVKAGYFIPSLDQQFMGEGGVSLTALDYKKKVSYTVIFVEEPSGVIVITGVADLFRRRSAEQVKTDFPLFATAKGVVISRGEGVETIAYRAAATPAQIEAFYSDTLTRVGFRATDDGWFVRGGEEVRVGALAHSDQPGAVDVTIVRRGAPPPAAGDADAR